MPNIPVRPAGEQSIQEAAELLRNGKTVVYPTETAYALGADPRNSDAVEQVFRMKRRSAVKPLGCIAASLVHVEQWCVLSEQERSLAERYWPGALSLVLRLRGAQSDRERQAWERVTAGSGRVSVRVTPQPWARALAVAFGGFVIATSANRSGWGTVYSHA